MNDLSPRSVLACRIGAGDQTRRQFGDRGGIVDSADFDRWEAEERNIERQNGSSRPPSSAPSSSLEPGPFLVVTLRDAKMAHWYCGVLNRSKDFNGRRLQWAGLTPAFRQPALPAKAPARSLSSPSQGSRVIPRDPNHPEYGVDPKIPLCYVWANTGLCPGSFFDGARTWRSQQNCKHRHAFTLKEEQEYKWAALQNRHMMAVAESSQVMEMQRLQLTQQLEIATEHNDMRQYRYLQSEYQVLLSYQRAEVQQQEAKHASERGSAHGYTMSGCIWRPRRRPCSAR